MPGDLRAPQTGPHGLHDTDRPVTRGQHQALSVLALELLGLPAPATRFEATVAIARLRLAVEAAPPAPTVPIPELEGFA